MPGIINKNKKDSIRQLFNAPFLSISHIPLNNGSVVWFIRFKRAKIKAVTRNKIRRWIKSIISDLTRSEGVKMSGYFEIEVKPRETLTFLDLKNYLENYFKTSNLQ